MRLYYLDMFAAISTDWVLYDIFCVSVDVFFNGKFCLQKENNDINADPC